MYTEEFLGEGGRELIANTLSTVRDKWSNLAVKSLCMTSVKVGVVCTGCIMA